MIVMRFSISVFKWIDIQEGKNALSFKESLMHEAGNKTVN